MMLSFDDLVLQATLRSYAMYRSNPLPEVIIRAFMARSCPTRATTATGLHQRIQRRV